MFVFKGAAHWFVLFFFFLHVVSFACVVSLQELVCLVPLLSFCTSVKLAFLFFFLFKSRRLILLLPEFAQLRALLIAGCSK